MKKKQQPAPPEPPPSIKAVFEPKPDIAAYELAILIKYLVGHPLTEQDWVMLGPAQRHIRRV